jgi:hypothetical protein
VGEAGPHARLGSEQDTASILLLLPGMLRLGSGRAQPRGKPRKKAIATLSDSGSGRRPPDGEGKVEPGRRGPAAGDRGLAGQREAKRRAARGPTGRGRPHRKCLAGAEAQRCAARRRAVQAEAGGRPCAPCPAGAAAAPRPCSETRRGPAQRSRAAAPLGKGTRERGKGDVQSRA